MTVSDEVAPDEWDCKVFLAVAETRGHTRAAELLSPDRPAHLRERPYARQLVGKTIKKIERWCGEPLFEGARGDLRLTERGRRFELAARSIVAEYRLMRRDGGSGGGLPRLACLPHHAQFVAPAQARLAERLGRETVVVEYLEPRHRGESEFRQHAVPRLQQGLYRIVIGPPVHEDGFSCVPLYEARMEAMVPAAHFPADAMSLTDLVQRHRLLLPPRDMRSRKLMEERIVAWGIDDFRKDERVLVETYDTSTSVMQLRHEAGGAHWDRRVVVVPSDVALAFKAGMEFGGRHAERFKWVPIFHEAPDGARQLLPQQVYVTVRSDARRGEPAAHGSVTAILGAIREAVRDLPGLSGG